MKRKLPIFQVLVIILFVLSFFSDQYDTIIMVLFFGLLLQMLDNLGKGIVLREIIGLHSTFVTLIMPLLGFNVFNSHNGLARLWLRYMPIQEDVYFSFALPAMCGFIAALTWPINHPEYSDHGSLLRNTLEKAKSVLRTKKWTGVILLAIGTVMFRASNFLPGSLQFFFLLLYFSSFAGFLYVYYAPDFRYKSIILISFGIFILAITLSTGMFTIVAYMGLTLFSFLFLGRKTSLLKKALLFVVGAFLLILIQLVKPAYRNMTWGGTYQGNKAALFTDLMMDKATNLNWQSMDAFFPVYYRTNQGFNIALVMRRVPSQQPHDYGINLITAVAAALVPRFLWPDKPEAGGKFNMAFYTGIRLEGWSTNIGPLGEAYGAFGQFGIAYMIFLGLFMRWAYSQVFKLARKMPLILFWIPVLFYQATPSAETDTLQILNSIFKSAAFIWILYKIAPTIFVEVKKQTRRRTIPTATPEST